MESIRYYEQEADFKVAVDCIIFGFDEGGLKLLLLKRNFEPCKGEWSLMGGFLRADENLDQAAERVLRDCTGLEKVYMEQFIGYTETHRWQIVGIAPGLGTYNHVPHIQERSLGLREPVCGV